MSLYFLGLSDYVLPRAVALNASTNEAALREGSRDDDSEKKEVDKTFHLSPLIALLISAMVSRMSCSSF